jgi:hypothetical protein|nr:MAG TPA: hypothetical protein [Caudoviricetes sp.]
MKLQEAINKFNTLRELYLNTFGANSLDRVIYCDPQHMTVDTIEKGSRMLANAIADGAPLEQVDEKTWENLIF